MLFFRVAFDFDAVEAEEISLAQGQVVTADDAGDGNWILVHPIDRPESVKGFAPAGYLKRMSEDEVAMLSSGAYGRDSSASAKRERRSAPRPPPADEVDGRRSVSPPSRRSNVPLTPPSGSLLASARPGMTPERPSPRLDAASAAAGAFPSVEKDTFTEMVADFRLRLKNVMDEREEAFRKLESSISATSKEIQMCQERNGKLTQRIIELDNWIEEERQKWKDQLEAEKKSLKMKSLTNYGALSTKFT